MTSVVISQLLLFFVSISIIAIIILLQFFLSYFHLLQKALFIFTFFLLSGSIFFDEVYLHPL
jgi:hypothetical protein